MNWQAAHETLAVAEEKTGMASGFLAVMRSRGPVKSEDVELAVAELRTATVALLGLVRELKAEEERAARRRRVDALITGEELHTGRAGI